MGNHWQLFSLTKISCSRPLDSLVDAAMSQFCSERKSCEGPESYDNYPQVLYLMELFLSFCKCRAQYPFKLPM